MNVDLIGFTMGFFEYGFLQLQILRLHDFLQAKLPRDPIFCFIYLRFCRKKKAVCTIFLYRICPFSRKELPDSLLHLEKKTSFETCEHLQKSMRSPKAPKTRELQITNILFDRPCFAVVVGLSNLCELC